MFVTGNNRWERERGVFYTLSIAISTIQLFTTQVYYYEIYYYYYMYMRKTHVFYAYMYDYTITITLLKLTWIVL